MITTPNTGGPDVVEDGIDGFIVPIRDPEAIAHRLTLLREDPARLAAMSFAARQKAAADSWAHYEGQLVALIRSWLGQAAA